MPLTQSDKAWLQAEFRNVRSDIEGIHKTLYGAEGRSGLVADVNEAKLNARKARERTLFLIFPSVTALVGAVATLVVLLF